MTSDDSDMKSFFPASTRGQWTYFRGFFFRVVVIVVVVGLARAGLLSGGVFLRGVLVGCAMD